LAGLKSIPFVLVLGSASLAAYLNIVPSIDVSGVAIAALVASGERSSLLVSIPDDRCDPTLASDLETLTLGNGQSMTARSSCSYSNLGFSRDYAAHGIDDREALLAYSHSVSQPLIELPEHGLMRLDVSGLTQDTRAQTTERLRSAMSRNWAAATNDGAVSDSDS